MSYIPIPSILPLRLICLLVVIDFLRLCLSNYYYPLKEPCLKIIGPMSNDFGARSRCDGAMCYSRLLPHSTLTAGLRL